ncbi:MAG: lysine transporter LysE [Rhodospirillaceae bacterium]|nr:lysine transporter LysE [Rhodospirillaceae bacterium]|tara:strand:- start:4928 stop:5554 length:627 start_codon:yes stop_codon:yes gene_type:complete
MDFHVWLQIALVCAVGAMSPGPSLVVVVRNVTAGGRMQGVMVALGHGLGITFYAFAAVTGLALLMLAWPPLHTVAAWAGALLLLAIGVSLWRASLRPIEGAAEHAPSPRGARGFAEGFAIAFLNPKIAAFFLALFSPFVGVAGSWGDKILVAGTAGVIDVGWYMIVALIFTGSGVLAWLRRNGVLVDRLLGTLLIVLALGLAAESFFA